MPDLTQVPVQPVYCWQFNRLFLDTHQALFLNTLRRDLTWRRHLQQIMSFNHLWAVFTNDLLTLALHDKTHPCRIYQSHHRKAINLSINLFCLNSLITILSEIYIWAKLGGGIAFVLCSHLLFGWIINSRRSVLRFVILIRLAVTKEAVMNSFLHFHAASHCTGALHTLLTVNICHDCKVASVLADFSASLSWY